MTFSVTATALGILFAALLYLLTGAGICYWAERQYVAMRGRNYFDVLAEGFPLLPRALIRAVVYAYHMLLWPILIASLRASP